MSSDFARAVLDWGPPFTREKVVFVVRSTWSEMSMFDLFLAALSLAPLGLFLLFWRVFPRDTAVHPLYRESALQTTGKKTEVPDMIPRRLHTRTVQRKDKVA